MDLFLTGTIGEKRERWKLDGAAMHIGRSSRNEIQIADGTVSKSHAEIVRRGERWFLHDLGSRNGTRVNGASAVEALPLGPGDHVEIGHVQLEITTAENTTSVRFNDATVVQSSLRMRLDQVLDRQSKTGGANQVLHLLAEAGQLLVLPRPLRETCDQILMLAERAVPASRHILLLKHEGSEEPEQIAARTRGASANEPLVLSRSILRTVLDECASVLTRDAGSDPRFMAQHSIVAQRVRSALAVPLFDNEKVLGLIYVDSQDANVHFGEGQLEVLTLLANMAAVKITNARLLEDEQERSRLRQEAAAATRIQRGLLPDLPGRVGGFEVEAFIEACHEVGGDLFDLHTRRDGTIVLVVGDVTGKGMGAALLMSSFLSSARVLYDSCPDPVEFAARLGALMNRNSGPGRYVTGVVGWLDPATGLLTYVNAGHPPPCVVSRGNVTRLATTGVPFGILPDMTYETATVTLAPGQILALFSDGIPEAQKDDEFFEDERLEQALLEASELPTLEDVRSHVLGRVDQFLAGAPRSDDLTLVLLRRAAVGNGA